jgi:hypothetical protein
MASAPFVQLGNPRTYEGFARAACFAGERDDAMTWLRACASFHPESLPQILADPDLRSLHGDPAFEALRASAPTTG